MTDMPQMIALYNGMGGGAAAAIAAVELYKGGEQQPGASRHAAVVGGLIGAVSFGGSLIAFAKLQGLITGACASPARRSSTCRAASLAAVVLGVHDRHRRQDAGPPLVSLFFAAAPWCSASP